MTTEDGTGIVHIAPTFGADDARVAKMAGIPAMLLIDKLGNQRPLVDLQGRFYRIEDIDLTYLKDRVNIEDYKQFAGRYVKNAYDSSLTDKDETLDISICMMLKQQGLAFKIEKHVHNYPHCWRTDMPVLYYPLDSWFIKSTARKDEMFKLNETIKWKPQSTDQDVSANGWKIYKTGTYHAAVIGELHFLYGEQKTVKKKFALEV